MFNYDHEKGASVFKEGARGGYMFFIVDGEVDITKQLDTAHHTIVSLA